MNCTLVQPIRAGDFAHHPNGLGIVEPEMVTHLVQTDNPLPTVKHSFDW